MGQFTHDGVVYEELPNGQARAIGYAQTGIQTKAADPMIPLDTALKGYQVNEAAATAPYAATIASAEAQKAVADAARARAEADAAQAAGASQEKINELRQRDANLQALAQQLVRSEAAYDSNLRGGLPNWIAGRLPTSGNDEFEKLSSTLLDVGQSAFRIPGSGDQSANELAMKLAAVKPSTTGTDRGNDVNFQYLRDRTNTERQALGLKPIDWQALRTEIAPQYAAARDGQGFSNEADKRFQTLAQAAFDRGASRAELDALARQYKYAAFGPDLDNALRYRDGGGKGAQIAAPESGVTNLTTMNKIAGSPIGALGGAYVNGVLGGGLDEVTGAINSVATGRPLNEAIAEADFKKRLAREANPGMDAIGNIAGGLTTGLGVGALATRIAPRVGAAITSGRTFGPGAIASDVGYGATYGALENNSDRVGGASMGALAGAGGGMLGRSAVNSAGSTLTGVRNAAADTMRTAGIPLTPGQIIGGRAKAFEEKLSSMPFVGDLLAKRQGEGLEAFNQAAFQQFSPNVTATGAEGLRQSGQVIRRAYGDALDNVNVPVDQQFLDDMVTANTRGAASSLGGDFTNIMTNRIGPIAGNADSLSGKQAQDMFRVLRNRKSAYGRMDATGANPAAADVVDALGGVEGSIMGLLNRQSPETMPALNEANRLYGNKKVLEGAVMAGRGQKGQFTPYQLDTSSISNTRKFGGQSKALEGDRPFFDLTQAGMDTLSQRVPNSGTADRQWVSMVLPAALGGAGTALDLVDPETALMIAGAGLPFALPYTKAGRSIAEKTLSSRSPKMRAMGEKAKKASRLGGMMGSLPALQYVQP